MKNYQVKLIDSFIYTGIIILTTVFLSPKIEDSTNAFLIGTIVGTLGTSISKGIAKGIKDVSDKY